VWDIGTGQKGEAEKGEREALDAGFGSAPWLSDDVCASIVAAPSIATRRSEPADRAPLLGRGARRIRGAALACLLAPHEPHIGLVHQRGGKRGLFTGGRKNDL